MAKLSIYLTILNKAYKEKLYHRGKTVMNLGLFAVRILLLLSIYKVVYLRTNSTQIGGLSFESSMWSIAIYFILLGLQSRQIAKVMGNDIRTGDVELKIIKPYNYIFYNLFSHLGGMITYFVCLLMIAVPYLVFIVGIPDVYYSPFLAIQIIVLFIGGTAISFVIGLLVGCTSFWIEDNIPVYWIVDKGLMILGGSYIPVAYFSPELKAIAVYSPFGAQTLVNQFVYPDFNSNFLKFAATQLFWIILLIILLIFVYKKGLKNLSVNGG